MSKANDTEDETYGPDVFKLTMNGTVAVPAPVRHRMDTRFFKVEEQEDGSIVYTPHTLD